MIEKREMELFQKVADLLRQMPNVGEVSLVSDGFHTFGCASFCYDGEYHIVRYLGKTLEVHGDLPRLFTDYIAQFFPDTNYSIIANMHRWEGDSIEKYLQ